jgi:hypothetical protein
LVAQWQARHAENPQIRAAMKRIARDETRHSALAWQTHRWICSRLESRDRERVIERMCEAARELSERRVEPPSELERGAGMPGPAASAALASFLNRHLWNRHGEHGNGRHALA